MDNYKTAFIYGSDDETNNFKDGQIHLYGEAEQDLFHNVYLLNYIEKYYPNIPLFKQLNPRHPKEIIAYFLAKMGHVVFFNTTNYEEKKLERHGKLGMFMMPDNLTEKQKAALIQFAQTIPDFDVLINYDLKIEDGLLNSQTYQSTEKISPETLINSFLQRENMSEKTM